MIIRTIQQKKKWIGIAFLCVLVFFIPSFAHGFLIGLIQTSAGGLLYFVTWVVESVFAFILSVTVSLFDATLNFTLNLLPTFLNSVAISTGWEAVRDMVNIVLVAFFVWFAVQLIIGKADNKGVIIKIFIAALLVNFSALITKIPIDISNVAIVYTRDVLGSKFGGESNYLGVPYVAIGTSELLDARLTTRDSGTGESAEKGYVERALYNVGFTLLHFALIVSFLVASIFLLIRIAVFFIVVLLSPIGLVATIVNKYGIEKIGSVWMKKLIEYSIQLPIALGLFFLVLHILEGFALGNIGGSVPGVQNDFAEVLITFFFILMAAVLIVLPFIPFILQTILTIIPVGKFGTFARSAVQSGAYKRFVQSGLAIGSGKEGKIVADAKTGYDFVRRRGRIRTLARNQGRNEQKALRGYIEKQEASVEALKTKTDNDDEEIKQWERQKRNSVEGSVEYVEAQRGIAQRKNVLKRELSAKERDLQKLKEGDRSLVDQALKNQQEEARKKGKEADVFRIEELQKQRQVVEKIKSRKELTDEDRTTIARSSKFSVSKNLQQAFLRVGDLKSEKLQSNDRYANRVEQEQKQKESDARNIEKQNTLLQERIQTNPANVSEVELAKALAHNDMNESTKALAREVLQKRIPRLSGDQILTVYEDDVLEDDALKNDISARFNTIPLNTVDAHRLAQVEHTSAAHTLIGKNNKTVTDEIRRRRDDMQSLSQRNPNTGQIISVLENPLSNDGIKNAFAQRVADKAHTLNINQFKTVTQSGISFTPGQEQEIEKRRRTLVNDVVKKIDAIGSKMSFNALLDIMREITTITENESDSEQKLFEQLAQNLEKIQDNDILMKLSKDSTIPNVIRQGASVLLRRRS